MGVAKLVYELLTAKAKIKGVFNRLYCCYGNLLCPKITIIGSPIAGHLRDTNIVVSFDKRR